jgi:hypothetical protein
VFFSLTVTSLIIDPIVTLTTALVYKNFTIKDEA